MTNVKTKKEGQKLIIEVDLSVKGTPSKSGKSVVLASTEGNIKIDPDSNTYLGLNVYQPR